ncbi:hypothetical protein [Paenibacillus flagellatus]|uniref:Gfo/Idh/MocA-like oxidoreductase N-terminal domain-containing protein n=1 Tax=Paenibacillus flagellatus TaxID=2211139 RepID=A0A2V5KA06_9BACL|nr:hypothetical protein [Paenibacillus flagellatus]PYI56248.1 hypothetical protein DLM86_04485 [Paenibacillus flagellatus]
MKTIGFIDYFLDEWHANQYPEWIASASGGTMKVAYAYGKIDAERGLDNASWCRNKGIGLLGSIEEVVERSDYLVVLSPDNPEFHEELAMLPLQSGKPTYVDKTFAPDRQTALLLFETAAKHGTPLFSSSALRFATEYAGADRTGIDTICSIGPGPYANYAVHQIEPVVSLMGAEAERVMNTGTEKSPSLLVGFSGGRQASIHFYDGSPFSLAVNYQSGQFAHLKAESDFFAEFIGSLIRFFETGEAPVDPKETIAIMTIIEYGFQAARKPYQWIELPKTV